MAIVRDLNNVDSVLSYLWAAALFCGISCSMLMLRFRGFRATLDLSSGAGGARRYELAPQVSVTGAYRTNREEYFGNIDYVDARKKITPSMVKLPHSANVVGNVKPSRSTGDLSKVRDVPVEVRKSTPNVSVPNVSSAEAKKQVKEQKKLEKQRLAEEKKREKLAVQERAKQEKLKKEREKQAAKEAKIKERQRNKKPVAQQPQQRPTTRELTRNSNGQSPQLPPAASAQQNVASQYNAAPPPPPPPPQPQFNTLGSQPHANPLGQRPAQYSTNTLDSSISRSSGPPPYSDVPEVVPNKRDNAGIASFGRSPEAPSSWDMISQHRQQMSRTTGATAGITKQKRLDLRYDVGNVPREDRENSEA